MKSIKSNIVLKILAIIAVAVVLFFGITAVITKVGVNKNLENRLLFTLGSYIIDIILLSNIFSKEISV